MSDYLNTGANVACSIGVYNMKEDIKILVSDLEVTINGPKSKRNLGKFPLSFPPCVSTLLERNNTDMTQVKWSGSCISPLNYTKVLILMDFLPCKTSMGAPHTLSVFFAFCLSALASVRSL